MLKHAILATALLSSASLVYAGGEHDEQGERAKAHAQLEHKTKKMERFEAHMKSELENGNSDLLLKSLGAEHSTLTQRRAAFAIASMSSDPRVPALLLDIANSEQEPDKIRAFAIQALADFADPSHAEPVSRIASESNSYLLINACLRALGNIPSDQSESTLIRFLTDDSADSKIAYRIAAIGSLARLKAQSAVPELIEIVRNSDAKQLRKMSVIALGLIGDERALPVLIERIAVEEDPMNQGVLLDALGSFSNSASIVPAITPLLDDENAFLSLRATLFLGNTGDARAGQPLVEAYRQITVPLSEEGFISVSRKEMIDLMRRRLFILDALSRTYPELATELMKEATAPLALRDQTTQPLDLRTTLLRFRLFAIKNLGYSGQAGITEFFVESGLTEDSEPEVRAAIARALAQFRENQALQSLQTLSQDPHAQVRQAAVWGLSMQELDQAETALLAALDDSHPNVVIHALRGLAKSDSSKAQRAIRRVSRSHPDSTVRDVGQSLLD